jgi:gas vesicle protein
MAQNTLQVRRDIERIRAELDETLDALGDHVRPSRIAERRTRPLRRSFRSARERVMGTATSAVSSASDGVQGAQSQAAGAAGEVVDRARETPQWVAQETRGNPLMAGLVSFGVGLLVGSLAPATEAERHAVDAMSDQLEPVRRQAVAAAASVKEEASGAASDAAQHLRDEVRDAAHDVQSTAQESAGAVKEQAQQGAREVAETKRSDA